MNFEGNEDMHVHNATYLLICAFLLIGSLVAQHCVHKYKLNIPEAILPVIIGIVCSGIGNFLGVYADSYQEEKEDSFDATELTLKTDIFFFGFLPWIVFNGGYHMKRKLLYSNFGAVASLAFLGSLISLLLTAGGLYYMQVRSQHFQLSNL